MFFDPCLLWPNGWMDDDATWYGGRPRPRRHCVDGDPAPPPLKVHSSPRPIFGQCPLWPNGFMDYDGIWYGGMSRPRPLCVQCGPSYPQKKGHTHPIQFLAHFYCDQKAGWMKTPLGTEVDFGPGHIVLNVVPAPAKGVSSHAPLFGPCVLWPRLPISATAELLFKFAAAAILVF